MKRDAIEHPVFTNDEAGAFKPVSLEWLADEGGKGRQRGARLESRGPQIAWDNVRLVPEELARQFKEIVGHGFGGAFFRSRAGLDSEYLGKLPATSATWSALFTLAMR